MKKKIMIFHYLIKRFFRIIKYLNKNISVFFISLINSGREMASIDKNSILLYLGLSFGRRVLYISFPSFAKDSFLLILISIFPISVRG